MIVINLAEVAVWLALIFRAFQFVIGFGIATEFFGPYDAALARYGLPAV